MIISIIALIAALGGTAWAAGQLKKNSVGSRQLKSKSVTTGKIANNAVTGSKVLQHSLDGSDIDLSKLGKVPASEHADSADIAGALTDGSERRTAGCPAGATLVRGICFDKSLSGPVKGVKAAADGCAAKGGWLPTTMELFAARNVGIFLGSGSPPDYAVTDNYFADPGTSNNYSTMVVDSSGTIKIISADPTVEYKYICVYPLVR